MRRHVLVAVVHVSAAVSAHVLGWEAVDVEVGPRVQLALGPKYELSAVLAEPEDRPVALQPPDPPVT